MWSNIMEMCVYTTLHQPVIECMRDNWPSDRRADPTGVGVRGIIVAHDITARLRAAVLPHENISVYTYQFSAALAPVVTDMNATR